MTTYLDNVRLFAADPRKKLLAGARRNADGSGRACTITLEDIVIPEHCPLTGVRLETCVIAGRHNQPSLDRVDSSKGYVPGNVRVISYAANVMKRDINLEFAKRLVEYLSPQRG